MFGIGLPEFILILALALIVVGPDKLPDLARSVAKGILDLKKTANTLKESLTEEGNILDEIKPELEEMGKAIKEDVLAEDEDGWTNTGVNPQETAPSEDEGAEVIDVSTETVAEGDGEEKPAATADKTTKSSESAE